MYLSCFQGWHHTTPVYQSICVFSPSHLHRCVLSRLVCLVASALALVEPLSTLCPVSPSHSLLSPHSLGRQPQSCSRYLSYKATSGPIGVIMAIVVSAILGWFLNLDLFFSVQDSGTTVASPTGQPVMQIF